MSTAFVVVMILWALAVGLILGTCRERLRVCSWLHAEWMAEDGPTSRREVLGEVLEVVDP